MRLFNVPAYLHAADVAIDVPGLGPLRVDVAYGGNYYVIIEPQPGWRGLDGFSVGDIQRFSPLVRAAAQAAVAHVHPDDARIAGVPHVMWGDRAHDDQADARNVVFYGARGVDRSPCGTGSCARMAQRVAKGQLAVGATFRHQSLIGTVFDCRVEGRAAVGPYAGILPSVAGWARVTGYNTILVDSRDPLAHGFEL